jgi:hypothetical protein
MSGLRLCFKAPARLRDVLKRDTETDSRAVSSAKQFGKNQINLGGFPAARYISARYAGVAKW